MAYSIMPIYNTDAPVGQNKANKPDDVRLIQTLLLGVAQTHPRPPGFPPPVPLSVTGMPCDAPVR